MKITDLELFYLQPRWLFLKISTDEGICGWGEPIVEGRAHTVAAAVEEYRPVLIGADPCKIEHLVQLMYRGTYYRGGPVFMSAISGIEQALWDIKGKYYHMPIYEMLGGACRDRVRMYGHLKPAAIAGDFPVEEMLKIADQRLAEGFTAVNIRSSRPSGRWITWKCSTPLWTALRRYASVWAARWTSPWIFMAV